MAEFMPAPWKVEVTSMEFSCEHDYVIGNFKITFPIKRAGLAELQAASNLISASPDMYEALKEALPKIAGVIGERGLHPEQLGYICEGYKVLQQIKQALAKAEGKEAIHEGD